MVENRYIVLPMQILTHHLQKQSLVTKEKRLITVMSKMASRDLISVSETSERFFKGKGTADVRVFRYALYESFYLVAKTYFDSGQFMQRL